MGRRRTGTAWEKPKGSGVWLAAITLADGSRETAKVPPRKSGARVDQVYAKAYARDWQCRYDEGEWKPAPKATPGAPVTGHTVGTWATAWAAGSASKGALAEQWVVRRMLCRDPLADVPIGAVTTADVEAFVRRLRALPSRQGGALAPRSVRRYVEITHRAIDAARAAGLLAADPWEHLPTGVIPAARDKVPGARRGWRYATDEVSALIGDPRIPEERRALYAVAFGTGARVSEIIAIRWREWERRARPLTRLVFARGITGRGGYQVERETKTGAVKEAPVHPVLEGVLASWWSEGWEAYFGRAPTADDRVFARPDGSDLYANRVWRQLQEDCEAVGIRPRRLHGTRHTTIRLAREGGADRDAMKAVTHAPRSTGDAFGDYDQPSWERLCEAVGKLDLRLPQSDSAPDSAPAVFVDPRFLIESGASDLLIKKIAVRKPRANARGTPGESAGNATGGGDSAPGSATGGALSGELGAYLYLELVEAYDFAVEWLAPAARRAR